MITSRLTYDAGKKTFFGEISDFKGELLRVYDDACDVGFDLVSERTGKTVRFVMDREVRDGDGDVREFIFVPVKRSLPEAKGIRVRLLND